MAGSRARFPPRPLGIKAGLTFLLGVALLPLVTSAQDEGVERSNNALPVDQIEEAAEVVTTTTPAAIVPKETLLPAPHDLQVIMATQRSIRLGWRYREDELGPNDRIESFRIFYTHHQKFEDVKVIQPRFPLKSSLQEVELTDLEPYTIYVVRVRAVIQGGRTSPESNSIPAHTDVNQPGAPILMPLRCNGTGALHIKWRRPEKFDKSVDEYKIYFRPDDESLFSSLIVTAPHNEEVMEHIIRDLDGSKTYTVKICAGTRSVINPNETWLGEPSREVSLYIPEESCRAVAGSQAGELSFGMILGAVCAVLFLIMACIGFVVWRRYFKSAYYEIDDLPKVVAPMGVPDWEDAPGPDGSTSGSINVEDIRKHVAALHADGDIGFSREYNEIKKYCEKELVVTSNHCSHADNKCKNRYLNISAYDHSRVVLAPIPGAKKTSDYINANFIDGFGKFHAYIGTQGPLTDTTEAFWRMVWEQNVAVIVMITNLDERGRRKCDMYWPKDVESSHSYGFIEVTLEKEEMMANYTVRTMKIKHTKLRKKKGLMGEREVLQFHYTSWPDHGVPAHPLPVLSFIRKSVAANKRFDVAQNAVCDSSGGGGVTGAGPIIAHCSAGVGRTGTYICIDALLNQIKHTGKFNAFGFLKHIRGQRNYLVQTEEQFVFIHDAIVEALDSGDTEVASGDLAAYIESLLAVDVDDSTSLLDKQFELITRFKASDFNYLSARKDYNEGKNRDPELIPIEAARVALASKPGVEGSDYINATWLHGHNKLREFVVTQHPTLKTREEFWRLLWDHNAQTIVLLSSLDDEADQPIFWPLLDDEFDFDTFRVRYIEKAIHEGHSTFDFVLSSCQDDYELTVRIIHCSEWPHNVSRNLVSAFDVLTLVQDWHLEYQRGPLVVMDRDGGTEAATFCALTTFCNQLKTDKAIDVYQVAKLYHNKRPGIWKSKDDILFMYKAMEALVVSSHMANPVAVAAGTSTSAAAAAATPNSASTANNAANPGSPSSSSSPTSPGTTPAPPSSTLTATTTASLANNSLANGSLANNNTNGKLGHERRHSDGTANPKGNGSVPSTNGGIKMSLVGVSAAVAENETSSGSSSRRHSLPPSNGDLTSLGPLGSSNGTDLLPEVIPISPTKTNAVVINIDDEEDDFDEDDERNSETARLTATV